VPLAAVFAAGARVPAKAWNDCTRGGWEDQMRGCTAIIESNPAEAVERRVTAYVKRGFAYEELRQDVVRAVADYSEAIRLDPARAEAYGRRGLAYARLGKDEAVVADLDKALSLDPEVLRPDTYRVYRSRGLANLHRREFDRAIADHSEEIRRTPFYADGYLNRGAAYLAKGEIELAIADFFEAIRVEPFRVDGYIARGSAYFTQGDTERALADFDEVIRRYPAQKVTAPAYRKRGEVLESRGDFAGALAAFEAALRLDPSDKEALAGRDRVHDALARQGAPQ
jgi:tetratricopeptide (TPR) repeat protein